MTERTEYSDVELNNNLYQENSKNEMFLLKDEVVEFIIEHLELDGESIYVKPTKSHDWYTPDDPGEIELSAEGKMPFSLIAEKFGQLSEFDLDYIIDGLKESDSFSEYVDDCMRDVKSWQIQSFYANIQVSNDEGNIRIRAEGEDFEIDDNDYGDN